MVSGSLTGRRATGKMLQLLVDMDGVVARLMEKWLAVYNAEYHDNLRPEDIKTWHAEQYARKCSPGEFNAIINRPGFFADLEVMPYAIEITKKLQDQGNTIYFVTATPYDSQTAGYDKMQWVDRHFPHIGKDHVIQAHHKNMVKGDLLLDDGPSNLEHFPGVKVAFDAPYNRNVHANYRISYWPQLEEVVGKIIAVRKSFGL